MNTTKIAQEIVSNYDFNKEEIAFLTPKMESLLIQFISVSVLSELPDSVGEKVADLFEEGRDQIEIVDYLSKNIENFDNLVGRSIKEFMNQF